MTSPIIIEATGKHTASIIFSHGLGDTARGWVPLAQTLSRKAQFAHIRFVLPTAPVQPVTANGGYRMTSWFDIQDFNPRQGIIAEDDQGMLASVRTIQGLVADEVDRGIPSERVLVGGFSQGAVIGYLTGMTSERKLAGIVALSGFLGMAGKVKSVRPVSLQRFRDAGGPPARVRRREGTRGIRRPCGQISVPSLQMQSLPLYARARR